MDIFIFVKFGNVKTFLSLGMEKLHQCKKIVQREYFNVAMKKDAVLNNLNVYVTVCMNVHVWWHEKGTEGDLQFFSPSKTKNSN